MPDVASGGLTPAQEALFQLARSILDGGGRGLFFDPPDDDLPQRPTQQLRDDDRVPQFGFAGPRYGTGGVLVLGINPGNGNADARSASDSRMMPVLHAFQRRPEPGPFRSALEAVMAEWRTWDIYARHCRPWMQPAGLEVQDIAYANALPWRTASGADFAPEVGERAWETFTQPLIEALRPGLVVALGRFPHQLARRAAATRPAMQVVYWNRARAATPAVLAEREAATRVICEILERG